MRRVRTVGPADDGGEVTVHVGDVLDVAPAMRPGGWRVTGYPKPIVRLQGPPAPADRHRFTVIAVGVGQLTPAGPGGVFTVRINVLRNLVKRPGCGPVEC